jgi:RNA polymerase sigma-70 factor (ECF subfamily)
VTLLEPAQAMTPFTQRRAAVISDADRVRRVLDLHYDAIWRFLRRLGVREAEVDDAAQKVFILFAERARSIVEASERPFLFSSAVKIAADARRKAARAEKIFAGGTEPPEAEDPAPNPEEALDAQRLRRWLDRVLDTLEGDHRSVLVLVDIEEQTMAEVAEVLGIPPGTVASRLRRARELFEATAETLRMSIEKEDVR